MSELLTVADRPPFVVFGLDSARHSGVALARSTSDGPRLVWTDAFPSEARTRTLYAETAMTTADKLGAHLIVVHEKFVGRPHIVRGSAKQLGKWLHVLEEVGVHQNRIVETPVRTWRIDTYGDNRRRSTDEWKALALAECRKRWGLDIEHDAAEAALLAAWGLTAQAVLRRVPKRPRRPR